MEKFQSRQHRSESANATKYYMSIWVFFINGIGPAKDGGNLAAEIKPILGWLGKDGDGLGNCKGWVYGF